MDSDSSGDLRGDWVPEESDFYPTLDGANFKPQAEKKLIGNTRELYKEISARINKNTAAVTKEIKQNAFNSKSAN